MFQDQAAIAFAEALKVHNAKRDGGYRIENKSIVIGAALPLDGFILEEAAVAKKQCRAFEHFRGELLVFLITHNAQQHIAPLKEVGLCFSRCRKRGERLDVLMEIRKDFVLVLNKRVEHIVDLLSLVLCERGGLQPYGIELRFDNFLAAPLSGRFKHIVKLLGTAYFRTREFFKLLCETY